MWEMGILLIPVAASGRILPFPQLSVSLYITAEVLSVSVSRLVISFRGITCLSLIHIFFCGEELDESGSVRYEMRCNCSYHEIWTLSDGCCSLEPYDYKGFRYAKLLPGKGVNIRGIFVQTRHYPMEEGAEVMSRCV